jgi:hypothetical protein
MIHRLKTTTQNKEAEEPRQVICNKTEFLAFLAKGWTQAVDAKLNGDSLLTFRA